MKISIATANSRKAKKWKNQSVNWLEFAQSLKTPIITKETKAQYQKMTRLQKGEAKDVGGFVGGELKNGIRKESNVNYRSLITLDLDHVTIDVNAMIGVIDSSLECDYVIYSTHSHITQNPKLRLIIPIDSNVDADQYQAIARLVASDIGIDYFDDTTYQVNRLMYYPSISQDGLDEYVYEVSLKNVALDSQYYLKRYTDYRDISLWPLSSRIHEIQQRLGKEQEDPLLKDGLIGAFCRTYTITDVIEHFLSEEYEATAVSNRYTYTKGTSVSGAIVYDDKYLYSNHASDPVSMKLCNAFDLVRIHKYGALDTDSKVDTPINRLPSYIEMCKFATSLDEVRVRLGEERIEHAQDDFKEDIDKTDTTTKKNDKKWLKQLNYDAKGRLLPSALNCKLILENDSNLQGIIGLDTFNQRVIIKQLPWRNGEHDVHGWSDEDEADLRIYFERVYGLKVNSALHDAFLSVVSARRFHPVKDYLDSLEWDGQPRIEYVFIDYLGAEVYENNYTQAVSRKVLIAAVQRIYEPGCKFDQMTVLFGNQGIGKSTLLAKLGMQWFSDSLTAITGKESYEQLLGSWIIEMGELATLKKQEIEHIKQYITKREDRFRRAYARNITDNPRQCIFFGTTNEFEFLRDRTGNRRFWPLRCINKNTKNVFTDLTQNEVNQIWAEAVFYYKHIGEPLYLETELQAQIDKLHAEHEVHDYREELITDFLNSPITEDWYQLDSNTHIIVLQENEFEFEGKKRDIERTKVCALEVWIEALGGNKGNMTNADRKFINSVIEKNGWAKSDKAIRFNHTVGVQKGYFKT